MTATNRASTDPARAACRHTTDQLVNLGLDTAVPEGVRSFAEKSLAQTREFYDLSFDAFDASVTTFQRLCVPKISSVFDRLRESPNVSA